MSVYDPVATAKQGAVYMDAVRPAWFREIDLKTLDLAAYNYCILGQCFGSFYDGLQKIVGCVTGEAAISSEHPFAMAFGFNVPVARQSDGNYERLGLAWKAEIRKRRKKRKR